MTTRLITKPLTFEGAHQLNFLPPEHKCRRLHGHSWAVQITVGGELDRDGMLIDYAVLNEIWAEQIYNVIDHRFLNEIEGLEKPTTEAIAKWIAHRFQRALVRTVHESIVSPRTIVVERVHVREGFVGGEAEWTPDAD